MSLPGAKHRRDVRVSGRNMYKDVLKFRSDLLHSFFPLFSSKTLESTPLGLLTVLAS